jgi:hypothetical protein
MLKFIIPQNKPYEIDSIFLTLLRRLKPAKAKIMLLLEKHVLFVSMEIT